MYPKNTSTTSEALTQKRRLFRMVSCMTCLCVFMVFSILSAWIFLKFSLPWDELTRVGTIQEVQAFQEPVLYWENKIPFYVFHNNNSQLIALSAFSYRIGKYCLLNWHSGKAMFIDPCWGTHIDITGKCNDRCSGPPWEMTELPITIKDGTVWVRARLPDEKWYLKTVTTTENFGLLK